MKLGSNKFINTVLIGIKERVKLLYFRNMGIKKIREFTALTFMFDKFKPYKKYKNI